MQSRTKVEQRRTFTKKEKLHMLAKSNCKCSHCGTILDIYSMSVEHAVPISHAGMNDERNLVALCKNCNPVKADTVLTNAVPAYYKYLNLEPLLKLLEYVEEYCRTYKYFEWNNFTQEDDTLITPNNLPTAMQQIEYKEDIKNMPKLILHKARYCDLDSIVDFLCRRISSYGIPYEEIVEGISHDFLMGAIYCIKTPYNEIVGCFSVGVGLNKNPDSIIIGDVAYSDKYYRAMSMALKYILISIRENIKSKIYGILFMSTGSDKYTIVDELFGKSAKELTYFLPKRERDKRSRVWQIYCIKGNFQKQVSKNLIDKMTGNTKKELGQYQRDRKFYLTKVLSYSNYDEHIKKYM